MKMITRLTGIIVLTTSLFACNDNNNANVTLETTEQKASYSFGVDIAANLKAQDIHLDVNAFQQGLVDVYGEATLALTDEERLKAKTAFETQLRDASVKKQSAVSKENIAKGEAFLAANGKKPDVITTESGLQYKIITSGDGKQPKLTDTVTTHYKGSVLDGREFDSSYKRNAPASFPVTGVIKGWTEALQLMHVGDKWELYIPSGLAYGASKRSELITANSTLIFEIELLSIKE